MPGEHGRHFADALLANFSHAIIHACDPVTAKWAASMLGHEWTMVPGGGASRTRKTRPGIGFTKTPG
jgi:hypothetical protein